MDMQEKIAAMFDEQRIDLNKIRFFRFDYADVWFRDYGPIFLLNNKGELAMVHWRFNSWGQKYPELLKDAQIPGEINSRMHLKSFEPGIVLEGGSIDVNGEGAVLTTEQCLLNKNRNPELSKGKIEKYLQDYLGIRHVIWLSNGIAGDDADGHIDDLARFINPTTVVCSYEKNTQDEDNLALKKNYEILCQSIDQNG